LLIANKIANLFFLLANRNNCIIEIMGAIWWGTPVVSSPLFQMGGHNMPCPPTFFSLGFVFGEVSKIKVMFF